MNNIWQSLKKPIFILAPMEDVTDMVFRQIILETARPDIFFTEFTNVEGLCSQGRDKVAHRLKFTPEQQPVIAQIWGKTPEKYFQVAKELVAMGFSGIDINMGCPEKSVMKSGCCVALINDRPRVKEIINAVKEGAAGKVSTSVKTRIGLNTIITEDWLGFVLDQQIDALTVHGRTAKELSEVPAHWDEIAKVVKLRDEMKKETIIIGNGDVKDRADGLNKVKEFGVDGVMIGRGIFDNPWAFAEEPYQSTVEESLNLLLKHTKLFEDTWGNKNNFSIMKKFFKIYVRDFEGASELRASLMTTSQYAQVVDIIKRYKNSTGM